MMLLKDNRNELSKVKDSMTDHVLEDARTYVQKTDFKETVVEIKDTVKRIYEKMDLVLTTLHKNN